MSDNKDVIYVGDQKKNIYFYDEDIEILKKIGKLMLEQYESHQVIASDNLDDINDELIKEKPTIFILGITDSNFESVLKFIRDVRSSQLIAKTPMIILGSRGLLEKKSNDLQKWDVSFVPKAIRVPYFMGVLSSSLSKAESVDVEVKLFKTGEHLFREGDQAKNLYIVKKGNFQIYKKINNEIFNIATVGELEIIGEMSIVDKAPRSACALALVESEVYILDIGNIETFLGAQPFWLGMILKSVISRLRDTNEKLINKK
jgi:CRP-like cAMP-binding protein